MFGHVIQYSTESNVGEILGENKKRYPFHLGEWLSDSLIKVGQKVFYEVVEDEARNIELDEERVLCFEIIFKRRGKVSNETE